MVILAAHLMAYSRPPLSVSFDRDLRGLDAAAPSRVLARDKCRRCLPVHRGGLNSERFELRLDVRLAQYFNISVRAALSVFRRGVPSMIGTGVTVALMRVIFRSA